MNTEFRVYDEKRKRMIYLNINKLLSVAYLPIKSWDSDVNPAFDSNENFVQYILSEKMFYIWLKDKNGKEIFEGDIIKDEFEEIWEIVFDEHWAAFAQKSWRTFDSLELKYQTWDYESIWSINRQRIDYYNWEIIGNIYKNPELLITNK